jgi:hypothetical protein
MNCALNLPRPATVGLHRKNSSIDRDSTRRIVGSRRLDVGAPNWGELRDEHLMDCDERLFFVQKCQFLGGPCLARILRSRHSFGLFITVERQSIPEIDCSRRSHISKS